MVLNGIIKFIKASFGPSETKCVFEGHNISVILDHEEIRLYIDGQQAEKQKTYLFPEKDVALLKGSIDKGKRTHLVEVYGISGLVRAKIKICVDGVKLAGSDF